jgi:KipI family sensor histidine kinase inhibitor
MAEVVPAARTVMVVATSTAAAVDLRVLLETMPVLDLKPTAARPITIEVVYDGADLPWLAAHLGLSEEALITWHTGQTWRCAFTGFAPGFAYCVGESTQYVVPRHPSPRPSVPGGSVALADEFSAVYPKASPGGWRLIGRTGAQLWDADREQPALIEPTDALKYVAVRELLTITAPEQSLPSQPGAAVTSMSALGSQSAVELDPPPSVGGATNDTATLDERTAAESRMPPAAGCATTAAPTLGAREEPGLEVVSPGWLSLIEDEGRPGLAHLGISPSGAWDAVAAAAANAAVGNSSSRAVIETLGTLRVRARGEVSLAWSNGVHVLGPLVLRDGEEFTSPSEATNWSIWTDNRLSESVDVSKVTNLSPDGRVETTRGSLRGYLAVAGGFDVSATLGSCSRDVLSGLGPEPLHAGDFIAVAKHLAFDDAAGAGAGARAAAVGGAGAVAGTVAGVAAVTAAARVVRPAACDMVADCGVDATGGSTAASPDAPERGPTEPLTLNITMGPRDDWVNDASITSLLATEWEVSPESNRIGVRLMGTPLERAIQAELPSEGMVAGAIQLPPSGLPVLLMRDHPVTGGYPVIAVIAEAGISALAQAAPGSKIRFVAQPQVGG